MGSVVFISSFVPLERTARSPARLFDARDLTLQRQRTEAQAADLELSQKCTRAAAKLAAVVLPHPELWFFPGFRNARSLCHVIPCSLACDPGALSLNP